MQVHVHYIFQQCILSICMFYRKKRQHNILWQIIRIISLDYFRILYATTFTVVKMWGFFTLPMLSAIQSFLCQVPTLNSFNIVLFFPSDLQFCLKQNEGRFGTFIVYIHRHTHRWMLWSYWAAMLGLRNQNIFSNIQVLEILDYTS